MIIGASGTGKSTLGRLLAARTGLPLHHMDRYIWREGWIEAEPESIRRAIDSIGQRPRWIIEGWVDNYSRAVLEAAEQVIYLDYPGWVAAVGGARRWWGHRYHQRPELPADCPESFDPWYLAKMLCRAERPHIERVLEQVPGARVLRLRSRRAVARFVGTLF